MHAYPHVPHGYTHAMFGRCGVDLNSCIPTLGYLPSPAAIRQISAAKAPHRVIGPLVHHALTVGPYAFLFLVPPLPALGAKGGRVRANNFFYSRFLLSWRNGAQAAFKGGASDRCLSVYAGVRPPRGVTYSVSIRSIWLAAFDVHRSAPGSSVT